MKSILKAILHCGMPRLGSISMRLEVAQFICPTKFQVDDLLDFALTHAGQCAVWIIVASVAIDFEDLPFLCFGNVSFVVSAV
jgi:hypothetical protein